MSLFYCRICDDGTVKCSGCQGTGQRDPFEDCPKCNGQGTHTCPYCKGAACVEEDYEIIR